MKQAEFGYRIRQALDESTERLDYKTSLRLEMARKAALARHAGVACAAPVRAARLAAAGGPELNDETPHGWLWQAGWILPLLLVAIGFLGIYEYQSARRVSELADIDFAVLVDTTPIAAYADKGLGVYLKAPLPTVEAEAAALVPANEPVAIETEASPDDAPARQ